MLFESVLRFTIIGKKVGKGLVRMQCSAREGSGLASFDELLELPLGKEKSDSR